MAAQDELELLERVFLRVGSAETDDQLQNVVFRFLPPVLLKLSSSQDGVRKKVLELLVHFNKRLKSRSKVQIPVEPLLVQYQDPSSITFVTNFTILYLKMGYPRLAIEKQAELAPSLIQCLEGKPPLQQDGILQMVIPTLPHLKLPDDPNKRKAMFGLSEKPATVKLLLDFMLDYLLLPYTFTVKKTDPPDAATEGSSSSTNPAPTGTSAFPTPPGLSANILKRLLGEGAPPDGNTIEKFKVGIVKFLSADVFMESDSICHLIIASSDTRYSVATKADVELKRIQSSIDWNMPSIVSKLYALFQGSVAVKGQPASKPDDKRQPVSTRVRLKLFPFLLRSREAADYFPASIQVVFDCLYGTNTNTKLKTQAVQFVHHLCQACSNSRIQPMGPILLSGMAKLIAEAKDNAHLRGLAYIAVGKLSKRLPHLFTKDLALLQQFFSAVCSEESDVRLHVQEALSLMTVAYKDIEGPNMQIMEILIMSNIEKSEPQARMVAVQYAHAVFPGNHIPSRYPLLLASGDNKEDIRLEALRALKPPRPDGEDHKMEWERHREGPKVMPDFAQMVKYIHEKASDRVKSNSRYMIGTTTIPFKPDVFNNVIFYLRSCLLFNADVHLDPDNLFDLGNEAPKVSEQVQQILDKTGMDPDSPIMLYIGLIQQLLSAIGGETVMYCLLEIVAVASDKLAAKLVGKLLWIRNFMRKSREEMRTSAAQLFAIVANSMDTSKLVKIIEELTRNTKDQILEAQHGSLLALGYTIGRYLHKKKMGSNDLTLEDMETDSVPASEQLDVAIKEAVKMIASFVDNSNPLLCTGSCIALGEIGRNGCLPIPSGSLTQQSKDDKKVEESTAAKKGRIEKVETWTKALVVERLVAKLESGKISTKLKEHACTSLGFLPVGDPKFPFRKALLEGLVKSASTKQIELHFSVGEALSHSALGQLSPASRDTWTEAARTMKTKDHQQREGEQDWVAWLLDRILKEDIRTQNPHKRQAACVWLLSLVKHCGVHPAFQARLTGVQQAFVNMLSENDEFTQDAASKGLSLVYEQSSAESRKDLVSILVDTLMTGKRQTKQNVTGDTKLFDEGSLGKAPTGSGGGSLSTYKELCALASDLNQPDLIYKFMHLANHNAMWNSRKGAAFGFSTIAAQAGEQLAPYLPSIVPKLYRYQYDPSGNIRQAMSSIWSALVKDNKQVVDTYLQGILDDLLTNLTSNMWRNRESSCLALSDLVRGRNLDDVVGYLPELWESCFRVLDDIKESVRKAAEAACRSLSKVSIKMCDLQYGKVGDKAIALVLPCLLTTGLQSSVNEVRSVSLNTIVQISKNAGGMMKPHIPVLVTALLEALSGLEPQSMNYLSLHLGKTPDTQEKLDNMRISAAKSSPMMDTVIMCVQYVDPDVLSQLIPRINELIRSGIGVGTKGGCAHVLIMLSSHCPLDLAPFSGKILSALLAGLSDKSAAVRKLYGNAIGHIVKIAKGSSVDKLLTRLKTWYMEKDDGGLRTACGTTISAISRHNPDILKRHAALVLPLVFLAMHEETVKDGRLDESESVWEEVWLDSTPGTESGIKLYLVEIIIITKEALGSQSWPRKAQAARAMGAVAKKLTSGLQPPHLGKLLSALVAGLSGRTWAGKEALLKAIAMVCTSCRQALQNPSANSDTSEQPKVEDIIPIVFKECKKDKIEYKMEALRCMGAILHAHQIDKFNDLTDILFPILRKEKKDDDDSSDEENDRPRQELKIRLQESSYECLGLAWPHTRQTQDLFHQEFCQVLCEGFDSSTFKNQVAILKSLAQYLDRLVFLQGDMSDMDSKFLTSVLMRVIPALCKCLGIVKYLAIRKEAIKIVDDLLSQLDRIKQTTLLTEEMRGRLDQALGGMQSDTEPGLREKAAALRKSIKLLPKE